MNLYDIAIARKLSGGGGGSSDFSTATLTVTGSYSKPVFVPHVLDNEYFTALIPYIDDTGEWTVVLFKGKAMLVDFFECVTSTSGNIESMGNGMYLITGDCTITVS